MTPRSLASLVDTLEQPFDVDALKLLMSQVRRAAQRERDGLRERIPQAAEALVQASAAAKRRAVEVATIDDQTRGGVLGTLLASADSAGVKEKRERAARALAGDLAVLERRAEDARALAAQANRLAETSLRARRVLAGLKPRAAAAEVPAADVAEIDRAAAVVADVPAQVLGLPAALQGPLDGSAAAIEQVGGVLGRLRSSGRASTVGEALLDGVVSPDSGMIGQKLRQKVAEAAPGWVPDLDRGGVGASESVAEIESERAEARKRAQRDAEARIAAMAELDALERDG